MLSVAAGRAAFSRESGRAALPSEALRLIRGAVGEGIAAAERSVVGELSAVSERGRCRERGLSAERALWPPRASGSAVVRVVRLHSVTLTS